MFDLIKELTELPGPVGQEHAVLDRVATLWDAAGATVERTRIGNLIGRAGGAGPRLLLAAHADELCYLVRSIDEHGYLWLANGQAWVRTKSLREWHTIGQRVQVLGRNGPIPGVIAAPTGHLATLALKEPTELTWSDFWVDCGLTPDELIARGVTSGSRVIWDVSTEQWGRNVVGKALDDRVPLAVITEVLRRVPPDERGWELTLACTVQEEIGLIGASALAATHKFDAAIVVEIGLAGDIPNVDERMMPLRLGAGPVLVHKDAMVHYDHGLTAILERTAGATGLMIQHAVFGSFGSDGAAFMKADIPAAMVAFPARYTHSAFETGNLDDIEALVQWLCAFVRGGPGSSAPG
jgi:tetrahedral aminopeptidase